MNIFRSMLILSMAYPLVATAQQTATAARPGSTVIRAGTLIDGKSNSARHDQGIVIRGNRIESVSDASSAKMPADAKVIDLSHAPVFPGLIDSTPHIFLQGADPREGGMH